MVQRILRVVVVLCWVVGVALVATSVLLVRQNRDLAARLEAYYSSIELPQGARVPPLVGIDRNGQELFIDSAEEEDPVLVLVFSPTCAACDENWPSWYPLVVLQRKMQSSVVAIDISGDVRDDYLQTHRIDTIPVMDVVSEESELAYRFRFTPQTLILHQGQVAAGWIGGLTRENVEHAERILAGTWRMDGGNAPNRNGGLPTK